MYIQFFDLHGTRNDFGIIEEFEWPDKPQSTRHTRNFGVKFNQSSTHFFFDE